MAGSIAIDTAALEVQIEKLQALSSSTVLSDALTSVITSSLVSSTGATAQVAKVYYEHLSTINNAFADLLAQTIAILQGASEYFTMTDEELAAYLAANTIR